MGRSAPRRTGFLARMATLRSHPHGSLRFAPFGRDPSRGYAPLPSSWVASLRAFRPSPVACLRAAPRQEHHYPFDVDASPEDIGEVFWYHGPDKPMTPG